MSIPYPKKKKKSEYYTKDNNWEIEECRHSY